MLLLLAGVHGDGQSTRGDGARGTRAEATRSGGGELLVDEGGTLVEEVAGGDLTDEVKQQKAGPGALVLDVRRRRDPWEKRPG